jgi:zinc protease
MRRPEHRPEVKAPPRWIFPEPARWWLDNGLQILASHRPGQHIAAVSLVLDTPLSTEPSDIEGVATITQRCLDEGTATHPGPTFAERLEDIGALLSGSAGYAASDLLLEVPASRLSEALLLLAQAISEPELRASDVERHQSLRLAEIEHTMANSSNRAQVAFRQACIPGRFRASRLAGGTAATVAAIASDDVAAYHARHYRPEGATLVISGDLTNEVYHQASAAFGGWEVQGTLGVHHQTPVSRAPHCWLIDRPGAVQADVRLGGFGIDRGDPRWADLQVATHALGGAFLSRLNRVLREQKGFTYGVHLVNSPMRDGGLLAVQSSFRTEVVPQALDLARQLLDVTGKPITTTEVLDAVNYTNGIAPLRYSTALGVTERVSSLVGAGLSAEFVNSNALALTRVTPESATQALTELLPPDALTLVVVGDAEALREPLVAAGWPVTLKD